jgi:hypothetical protein
MTAQLANTEKESPPLSEACGLENWQGHNHRGHSSTLNDHTEIDDQTVPGNVA